MLRAAPHRSEDSIPGWTVQGIEVETCMQMDPVFEEVLDPVHSPWRVFLCGPSLAREIVGDEQVAESGVRRVPAAQRI